jgi:hypothetical protein
LRPARHTTVASGIRSNSLTAPSRSPTPQPPPETTTTRRAAESPSAAIARLEEFGCDQRPHDLHAAAAGDPLDVANRRVIHNEMGVDPALRPEEQPRHVGDRRDRRDVEQPPPAQVAEHHGDRRIGRHDDVGVAPEDLAPQRSRAHPAEHLLGGEAHRCEVLEHPVVQGVGARRDAQLGAVAVLDDRTQPLPHRRQPVDDRDLDRLAGGLQLLLQRTRGCRMALSDISGKDQNSLRAGGTRGWWLVSSAEAQIVRLTAVCRLPRRPSGRLRAVQL